MQVIENLKVKEKIFIDKLDNGLTVIIIPRNNTNKKYAIWGINYGSIDNVFIDPDTKEKVRVPDGVAHFLEHKLFEQENGTNSLDFLSNLGVEANAYTTTDHTAYLFECTDNFYEGLDEFMNYVQNPYFTDENVEKEKGIIGQEIDMYQDYPDWQVYMNSLKCLYKSLPINIDITGSKESIAKIDKEILYKCYNTFYTPANMLLVVAGDFVPEEIIKEIQRRLVKKGQRFSEIKRIYPSEDKTINKKEISAKLEVTRPIYTIGIKDDIVDNKIVRRHIAIEILLNMLLGQSSKLYKNLYEKGIIQKEPGMSYEYSKQYGYVLISGKTTNPKQLFKSIKQEIEKFKKEGIDEKHFNRVNKKIYGQYVKEYNDLDAMATMFLADYFKGINSFDYIEEYDTVNIEYTKTVLEELFKEENMVISIINKE